MVAERITRQTVVAALWWFGVVLSVITLFVYPCRHGEIDLSLRSPFDNTRSGHAEQWIFLSEAAHNVPRGMTFTVRAPDRDIEMSLFMMAVGLLPEASPLPSSYYGQSTEMGDRARFVLEFEAPGSVQAPEKHSAAITGGRVTKRWATEP
jgi:hypothetical protein